MPFCKPPGAQNKRILYPQRLNKISAIFSIATLMCDFDIAANRLQLPVSLTNLLLQVVAAVLLKYSEPL